MIKMFRWRAVSFLLLCLVLLIGGWVLLGDWLVKRGIEAGGSGVLGTEVDVGWLKLRTGASAVEMKRLEIADPHNPLRNVLEAAHLVVDLAALPALEKKVVIDRMELTGLRFGTVRARPARPADANSSAGQLLAETKQWAQQFKAPLLALTPIDTIKSLVMDPAQLGTIKAANALVASTDSTREALEVAFTSLKVDPILDSAKALTARLKGANPSSLGLQGTVEAASSVKRTLDQISGARQQVVGFEKTATSGIDNLTQGLKGLDDARQKDYAFARELLKLPSFDAPNIGAALFGQQSTDVFQQALYYAQIAQKYIPPGLQPWRRSAPRQLRMAGTTVQFPRENHYPTFLLRDGRLGFSLGGDTTASGFSAVVSGLTTEPAIYGKPATFSASGDISGAHPLGIRMAGLLDHVRKVPLDSVQATVTGVRLPSIALPGLPFGVDPGTGSVEFSFSLQGDRIGGRWEIASSHAVWKSDSSKAGHLSTVENVLWQVVSGLSDLRVGAELGGTVRAPTLSVHSNLDAALAARLQTLVGDQAAKGEAKARAAVDRLVDEKVGPVKTKITGLQSDVAGRLGLQKQQLDEVQKQLESQLRTLTGGLNLPKIKL